MKTLRLGSEQVDSAPEFLAVQLAEPRWAASLRAAAVAMKAAKSGSAGPVFLEFDSVGSLPDPAAAAPHQGSPGT